VVFKTAPVLAIVRAHGLANEPTALLKEGQVVEVVEAFEVLALALRATPLVKRHHLREGAVALRLGRFWVVDDLAQLRLVNGPASLRVVLPLRVLVGQREREALGFHARVLESHRAAARRGRGGDHDGAAIGGVLRRRRARPAGDIVGARQELALTLPREIARDGELAICKRLLVRARRLRGAHDRLYFLVHALVVPAERGAQGPVVFTFFLVIVPFLVEAQEVDACVAQEVDVHRNVRRYPDGRGAVG
jgi:hypothetical protein